MTTRELKQKMYKRFTASQRMEHILAVVTFIGLALTGMPQRYADMGWAKTMISAMGGIESVRILHRFMATLLMFEVVYHIGAISYRVFVSGSRLSMIPTLQDLWNVRDYVLFNLGFRRQHPKMPRYNFGEKAEYLAFVWGTALMGLTGFMMWNPIGTAKVLPGVVIPAAKAAHSAEALLAVLSIVVWHMYNVHLRSFNRSMFTGKLSYEAMREEHADELERIERGADKVKIPPHIIAKRRRIFWPYAVVSTVVMLGAVFWFISFEESSITTVPRRDVVVFNPETAPETGDATIGENLWPTLRCRNCHGEQAQGSERIPALAGTTLPLEVFQEIVRTGRRGMPAFSPGDLSEGYLLHLWTWLQALPAR